MGTLTISESGEVGHPPGSRYFHGLDRFRNSAIVVVYGPREAHRRLPSLDLRDAGLPRRSCALGLAALSIAWARRGCLLELPGTVPGQSSSVRGSRARED